MTVPNPPQPPAPSSAPPAPPSAGAQPAVGQPSPKRPWWKKPWGIAVIVVGVLLVIGALGSAGGNTSENPSTPPAADVTAAPTETAQPSEATAASSAPDGSESAAPEPTDEPTAEPTEAPAVVEPHTPAILTSKAGRGDKVLKIKAQDAPTIARITNKGSSNFAVISYVGTSYDDLLVNEIGSYSGTVYLNPGVTRLKITSNGSWKVTICPIEAAKQWDGSSALAGKGDTVVMLNGGEFGTTTIKNKGKSNFAVIAYDTDGQYLDLLVNEIGGYSGEVLLPLADPIVLTIQDVGGTWRFSEVQ